MKVVIWGAGKFGRYIKNQLVERKDIVLLGFIDKNIKSGELVDGIEVITLAQAREQKADVILIAILEYASLYAKLKQENNEGIGIIKGTVYTLKKMLSMDLLNDNNILWIREVEKSGKPLLAHLETNVMDGCNLNCKGCSHFSNLFAQDESISFNVFCKDLQQIVDHTNTASLYLLGGEALLNNSLMDYLEFSRKLLPEADIQIVSNGLLVPSQTKEFFDCCRRNEIVISISGYRPALLMKDKIVSILEENQVLYAFRGDVLTFGKNIDLQGKSNPEKAFRNCRERACHFFRNGRIYKCPFEALGNQFFTHYDIDIRFNGGFDIYDTSLNWDELVERLDINAVDACCYCGEEERMEWAVENHPKLEDWVVRK